jgi:hypothetical protein
VSLSRYQPALFAGVSPTMQQVKDKMPLSPKALQAAEEVYIRAYASRCCHEPGCGSRKSCIALLAREMKSKGYV